MTPIGVAIFFLALGFYLGWRLREIFYRINGK